MIKIDVKNLNNSDKNRLAYYEKYADEYYNDYFRQNQGIEEIMDMLSKYGNGKNWLDVGSGPCTFFWGMALNDIESVDCSDICIEAHKVLHDFVSNNILPNCYIEAANLLKLNKNNVADYKKKIKDYLVFDALIPWPDEIKDSYDIVTCFGVFGLNKTPEEYIKNFSYCKDTIKNNGRILGANWKRSDVFVQKNGGSNNYLNPSLIEQAAKLYGYKILYLKNIPIYGDDNYENVLIWGLEKSN